ncbi:hypothetical protein [Jatrophihabitans sp.]|uniref:hypothetical protein n=1 Tax=Jatrophihabitans sp. TaxID=1932789 RepID=UPI002EDF1A96
MAATAMAGCADRSPAISRVSASSSVPGLIAAKASTILSSFDAADSAATVSGDIEALRSQETNPALQSSIAAARRNAAAKRVQPGYRHTNPTFATPTGDASCFMVAATLQSTGTELGVTDFSQFVATPDGSWRLSHNVHIGQEATAEVHAIGSKPAIQLPGPIPAERLDQVAAEIFNRSTGSTAHVRTLVAESPVLDKQLAVGWQIYQQQMNNFGMKVTRTRSSATWSRCTAQADDAYLRFLTMQMTDTVTPVSGGQAKVTLSPRSPDLAALGRSVPVSGTQISIARVEAFLVSLPASNGPATVLGLMDAPIALSSTTS